MTNAYNRFQSLVGSTTTSVITITTNNGNGTSTGTTLNGVTVEVMGEQVLPGGRAFVRNGEIIRSAPNLSVANVSV